MLESRGTTMQEAKERAGRRKPEGALRVVLAGGGTGGHLYPALAVAERFREAGGRVLFVGTPGGLGAKVVPDHGFPIAFVRARGLGGGVLGTLKAACTTAWGLLQSLVLLHRERPHLVVGSGGYVCAPVVLAAALLRIPSILMEQNAIPGKAIRLLARFARKVCVSFPGCRFGLPEARIEVTGNPIRQDIVTRDRIQARHDLGLPEARPCLLVTGASQGAASLNRAVLQALDAWQSKEWTVLHLTGPKHLDEVLCRTAGRVDQGPLDYRAIGYQEDIAGLYAAADLVVCRAGATTLAEITARGLPAILVPYPFAAERHQDHNAALLAERGAARILSDEQVGEGLQEMVAELFGHPERLQDMAVASAALGRPEAAARVVQVALEQLSGSWEQAAAPGARPRSGIEERGHG